MNRNLELRVVQIEKSIINSRKPVPAMIYFSNHQSYEEAAAEYEQKHGFKIPKDAPVYEIVSKDMRIT